MKKYSEAGDDFFLKSLEKIFLIDVLNHIAFGIFVTDKKGKVIYVNPAVVRQYGNIPENLVGDINWGKWEGVIYPPNYKQLLIEQRPLFYNQYFRLTDSYSSSATVPTFTAGGDFEYGIQIVQEDHLLADSLKNAKNESIYSQNEKMHFELQQLMKVSKSDLPILLLGESGTGKTHYARMIHDNSLRQDQPFITLNCGAIPKDLIESELFGYSGGAFTGAEKVGKQGFFEIANHGTIFLDEIGDMPLHLQVKLLHVLESQMIRRVGATNAISVDVRIITATNKDLQSLILQKIFREDLYWRIGAYTATIPSLRNRKEDIIPLANKFLDDLNKEYHTKKHFSPLVFFYLLIYSWPGNIRELKNAIQRAFILTSSREINEEKLPKDIRIVFTDRTSNDRRDYDKIISRVESELLDIAIQSTGSSSTQKISEFLKITYTQALYLKEKYL